MRLVRRHLTLGRLSIMWHGPTINLDDVFDDACSTAPPGHAWVLSARSASIHQQARCSMCNAIGEWYTVTPGVVDPSEKLEVDVTDETIVSVMRASRADLEDRTAGVSIPDEADQ